MPRDIPIGNGSLLINFDSDYHIRDFYYPHVGRENHSAGYPFRFGVWCDGRFSWVHDDGWRRSLDYLDDTLVGHVVLENEGMQLRLICQDLVDFHENIFIRKVEVENLAGQDREVRLFFHHDFHISNFEVGDTAYYNPDISSVIHYKDNRYFLINMLRPDGVGVSDFATGIKEVSGAEGTWRDAEDGVLGKNPISQGAVDSTVAGWLKVAAGGSSELIYWICVTKSYQDAKQLNKLVIEKKPQTLIGRTSAYWSLWVNKDEMEFSSLPPEIVRLYKRSLMILRTQIDADGGVLAANDTDITQFARDTYSYVWPRDGALVAHALDIAGYSSIAVDFYNFCSRVITSDGYFLHKYNADGSAGSSWHPWERDGETQIPIQEDETALVLWALWQHFSRYRDVEYIKPLYRNLIIQAADFLASYVDHRTGLPQPSYDLWEERRGVFSFTVSAVYGGLVAASNFAEAFGELDHAHRYHRVALSIRKACDEYLWRPDLNRFIRGIITTHQGESTPDLTIDASVFGLFAFGMYDPADPRICATMQSVEKRLQVQTSVGGIARYENDYYHQVSKDTDRVAGNPWFICTLWLAQHQIALARNIEELKQAIPTLSWVAEHALPSGVLAEQVNPYDDSPLSVSPLTWSHAAYCTAVVEYLDKEAELHICPECGRALFSRENRALIRNRKHHRLSCAIARREKGTNGPA